MPPGWRPEWRPPKRRGKGPQAQKLERERKAAAAEASRAPAPARAQQGRDPLLPWGPNPGTLYGNLLRLECALTSKGFPPMAPWWLEQAQRIFESTAPEAVYRVGRRGGKSSSISRMLVVIALYLPWTAPPGDVAECAVVSVKKPEARKRLITIKRILRAIGVETEAYLDGGIQLVGVGREVAFVVYAASLAGVVGSTCPAALGDEVARWKDADTGVNPATEVLNSLRPTMAGIPGAKLFLSSSPMGHLDAHAKAYELGDGPDQLVAWAPTWVARCGPDGHTMPGYTEAELRLVWERKLGKARFDREYGAIPLEGTDESMITPAMLDAATRREGDLPPEPGVTYVAAQDPGFTRNAWTLVIVAKRFVAPAVVKRSVVLVRQWRGAPDAPLDPGEVFREMAAILRPYGVTVVRTDRYERFGLAKIARDHGLAALVVETKAGQAVAEWEEIETAFASGQIDLHPDKVLRQDILGMRKRLTPNGFNVVASETADGRHCDYGPPLRLALAACKAPPVATDPHKPADPELDRLLRERANLARGTARGVDRLPAWMKTRAARDRW